MYEFGCLMLSIDDKLVKDVHSEIQKRVPESEIFNDETNKYGRETDPHITVLYGLHADLSTKDIMRAVTSLGKEYLEFQILGTSIFSNPKYDVLKIDIESDDLVKLNSIIKKFPHTSSFPNYHPHLTVAYLKPGTGPKYTKAFSTASQLSSNSNKFELSMPNQEKTWFRLKVRDMNLH